MANAFRWDMKAKDDAWYPDESEDYFQLWDLYSVFEQGYKCIAHFFYRPWYPLCEYRAGEANLPLVTLRITTPDNVTHACSKSYPASAFKASTETCDVAIGANKLTGKFKANGLPEEFHIKMAEDGLAVDLTYHVQIGGVKFTDREDGYTYYHPVTKKYFGWWPVTARSEVEGTLTVNGKTVKVKGLGLHDNNLGTAKLSDIQSRYFFATIYAGDYTIFYTDSTAAKRYRYSHFTPLVVWKGSDVILSTYNCAAYAERFDIDPVTKGPYPVEETFRASQGNIEVTGQLLPGTIVDSSKLTDIPGFPFTSANPCFHFFQFSDADIQIRRGEQVEKVKGQALRELAWFEEWFPYPKVD